MKSGLWAVAVAGIVLVLCGLPLAAVLDDTPAVAACTNTSSAGGTSSTGRAGAVGKWTSAQVAHAATIVAVGQRTGVPARGWVIAVATAMTESHLTNHGDLGDRNDHDSLGLFQQRPSQNWGTPTQLQNPAYAAGAFYKALRRVARWETLPLTVAAQRVQRSAFPDRYAAFENDAETVVAKVTGTASISDLSGASLADCGTGPAVVSTGGWTQPVHANIVSGFRTADRPHHQGVDLGAKRNTVIRAASGGEVVWAGCDNDTGNCDIDGSVHTPGCGWFVEILHAGKIATRYCHMVRQPDVTDGQQVKPGDPIGLVGTSGHSSGPHLHFEVHTQVTCGATRCRLSSENAINAAPFMTQHGAPIDDQDSR